MANMNFKANILPATSQGYNLGSSTQQWVIHGPIYTNGIFGTENVDYGTTLPSTATEGQIFFQTSNTVVYSVPAGGTAGYALVKDSNADGDFSWQEVAHESYSVLNAQQNGTSASLVTTGEKYTWNNAGTVKSVQVSGTSPIVSSNSASATTTLSTTISLADGYGDTKNPYASNTKNYVLAAPSNANGVPVFRAIIDADIPTLSITDKTSGTLPISRGGTNATTTAAAWTNLGGGSVGKLNLGTCATYYLANNGTWTTPPGTYVLPEATTAVLGGVTIDSDGGIAVDQGAISVDWSGAPVLSINNMTGDVELQSLTIGTKHYNGTTATVIGVTDLGLASPMTFRGVTDTTLVDGTNVTPINIVGGGTIGSYTPISGDVVLQKTEQIEYIYSGSEWTQLGLASSYSLAEHSHGYILNDGVIEATATVALNDRLLISDASDVGRVTRSNLMFDTTSTQAALSKSGSWVNYLQLSGGTMTGAVKTKGLVGTLNVDYGDILPTTATEGQVFFQVSYGEGDFSLPAGGTAGYALVKNSSADGDVKWGLITASDRVLKTGDTMSGNLLITKSSGDTYVRVTNGNGAVELLNSTNRGVYDRTNSKWIIFLQASDSTVRSGYPIYGAVWNDYAEFRQADSIEPGRVVVENGNDTLSLSTKRLERGCEIISDTFGMAIGETDKAKTPTAATGRVLAYPYESREVFKEHIGWPVCSGPNGTVSLMSEEEEEKYPSRIIGTVSAVPDYAIWFGGDNGDRPIEVNGRVWIRIR